MNESSASKNIVAIDTSVPVWDRFFTVAPLVLIGTKDQDGATDLAPKHMSTPLSWENFFGFVCTPSHGTYQNIERTGVFTVSYPRPSQVLMIGLAASPRVDEGTKPVIDYFQTFPAKSVDGDFIEDAYLYFECRHIKTIDGFGTDCLITGEIVAAYGDESFLRHAEEDDQEKVHDSPLLAFLSPGRFATIDRSNAFPFPKSMKK